MKKKMIWFSLSQCSLGWILVAQSQVGCCAIFLGDTPEQLVEELRMRFSRADLIHNDDQLRLLVDQVITRIENPANDTHFSLDLQGTPFQRRVWHALQSIPAGQTTTYQEIAHQVGAPRAMRAVGQACGANPLAVIIPCHRVVRTDGYLAGYRWGVERKRLLLENEKRKIAAKH